MFYLKRSHISVDGRLCLHWLSEACRGNTAALMWTLTAWCVSDPGFGLNLGRPGCHSRKAADLNESLFTRSACSCTTFCALNSSKLSAFARAHGQVDRKPGTASRYECAYDPAKDWQHGTQDEIWSCHHWIDGCRDEQRLIYIINIIYRSSFLLWGTASLPSW